MNQIPFNKKNPARGGAILIISKYQAGTLPFPFTLAITSSAILFGAGA